ncbi:MAG: hypothetical protein IJ840_02975, partial [Bacteroidales bacterium]|nr:hypothetical protein [Bacteroidales bacterium]
MTKYSFILLSGETEAFLAELEGLGVVDITRAEKPVDETSSRLFTESEECRKAIKALEAFTPEDDPDHTKFRPSSSYDEVGDPLELFQKVSTRSKQLKEEIDATRKEVEEARAWGNFDPQVIEELAARGLKIRFYKVPKKSYDPSWGQDYALREMADDGRNVWFVTVSDDPDYSFPAAELKAPENNFIEAEGILSDKEGELIACKGLLCTLKDYVPALRERLNKADTALQRYLADAGAGKAAENHITTFEGFAPAEDEKKLREAFDSMEGVLYLKEDALKEDNPPIKLKGNWFTRMFTVLTDMYGRPEYNEFDPTPYLSVFFLLFF